MKYKLLLQLLFSIFIVSCGGGEYLTKIEGEQISITDSIAENQEIEEFIAPYRDRINEDLDGVLAYSVDTYTKNDGELNTAIGNLMADIVYEQANPVFRARTNEEIDLVLLNHGGIRSIISKGNVSKRTAFEIMPFENAIVVAELKGEQILELIDFLVDERRAHPISKLKIELNPDYSLSSFTIKGKEFDKDKNYYVATNDYLYNGGSRMDFFQKSENLWVLDYKIRNALIDYFIKTDTLNPVIDDRFKITLD